MSECRTILEVLEADGQIPNPAPKGLRLAVKAVRPDWTTYGGYQWPPTGRWTEDLTEWSSEPCAEGGVHVATTLAGAQSGGAPLSHLLLVGYRPKDEGDHEEGKIKVRRAKTIKPVDLMRAIRNHGKGAYLRGALSDSRTTWPDGFDPKEAADET